MGFVKRNIEIEEFLKSVGAFWEPLSDREYRKLLCALNEFIEPENYRSCNGDDAFQKLTAKLPLDGYIFSAPKHTLLSIYEKGGNNLTFGYSISTLIELRREKLNQIECVVADKALTFACVFNHEWQAM